MLASVQNWKLELKFFFAKDEMAPDKNRCNSRILLKMQFLRKKNKTKQNKTKKTNDQNATRVCSKVKYLDQRKKTRTVFS